MDKDRQHMACPLNNKICTNGINESSPKHPITKQKTQCRWWQHLAGKDPQSEKTFDMWDCSIPWIPITTLETSQMARQAGAGIDKLSNITHKVGSQMEQMGKGLGALFIEFQNLNENIKNLPEPGKPIIDVNGDQSEGTADGIKG
jgi:hypothetical protein